MTATHFTEGNRSLGSLWLDSDPRQFQFSGSERGAGKMSFWLPGPQAQHPPKGACPAGPGAACSLGNATPADRMRAGGPVLSPQQDRVEGGRNLPHSQQV